jgi:hypothetical protein
VVVEGRRGCKCFNVFIAEVCGDDFPSTPVVIVLWGEEELEGTIGVVLSKA